LTGFFDERTEQSKIKTAIVVDYFITWAKILATQAPRIGYADLFCGPGKYQSGEKSTPLLILEKAIAEPVLRQKLLTLFNDVNPDYTRTLQEAIDKLPGVGGLKYKPEITGCIVDSQYAKRFEDMKLIPVLTFIDPWGYKGLSQRLLRSIIKDFGSECIFLFNYNRINMAIEDPKKGDDIGGILGQGRLQTLRREIASLGPGAREATILGAVGEAIIDVGGKYLIPFRFAWEDGRTSHYVCFVTKNHLGCQIMKEIMARKGFKDEDEVPRFEFVPGQAGRQLTFDCLRPLTKLPDDLLKVFAGQTISVKELIRGHHPGTPFIAPNYRKVIRNLRDEGKVICTSEKGPIRKGQMPDHVSVTFPAT
jgi:three-Cys-motif partner protein